jgi:hypothetical protein
LIEKHLRDTVSTLECNVNDSTFILYSIRDDIGSEDRMKIIRIVSFMFDEIRKIKEKFVLESEEETITSHLMGHLNEIWTTI